MDLSPFLTVVATGAVTLAGVWLNARYATRSEQRRISAEKDRLENEIERESKRLQRDDQLDLRARNEAAASEARELATEIAEAFLAELRDVREFEEVDENGFISWYETKWNTQTDIALRRLVGRVQEDTERARILSVIDALEMFDDLAQWYWTERRVYVEKLLILGFDVSATAARGQRPDGLLSKRLESVNSEVSEWYDYQEAQLEFQRAEAQKERAAKVSRTE